MTEAETDEQLVRKSQNDDERAFGELVSRYESKVYSLALKMLRNPEDAEDVLQDTFLRAYRGIKSFKGNSTFSTWVYRITANSALLISAAPPTSEALLPMAELSYYDLKHFWPC